jgi:hypothetical protein
MNRIEQAIEELRRAEPHCGPATKTHVQRARTLLENHLTWLKLLRESTARGKGQGHPTANGPEQRSVP